MTEPFVVVGGDAAGLSAASKLRREAPERDVVVFEKGRWVSYAHCGTPYFVKGAVDDLTDLLSLSPEDVEDRGIELRREAEVTAVNTDKRLVTVVDADGTAYEQPYAELLVATGGRATSAPIPGIDLDGVFTMHGLDSAATVRAYLSTPETFTVDSLGGGEFVHEEAVSRYGAMEPPEVMTIVGGGYVGVEMAEAFSAWDLDVHLFQRGDHPLTPFGEAVGERVASHLQDYGVTLHLGEEVEELRGKEGHVSSVVCYDGSELETDGVLVGIGIRPNVELLEGTEVELGDSGAIAVDEYGRTSVDGIYAAGDCAEMPHAVTGDPAWIPLGLTANRAGRAIGKTIAGDPTPVGSVAGTAVVKAFDLECGRTGIIDCDAARDVGFDPVAETITAGSRSGYYPGNEETTVTLVADRDSGRLLGGSIVGEDRAAVRIDTVATALEAALAVEEVEQLDLAYAPPFSPVWDPVLVAAKVLGESLSA
ncbi:FAD-dependent oxidoreductase [Halopelagius longus]|uniref:NADPH-dependent 2,4-dienoyl-CoA reductase, sulfur reductase n=1 Tax=Halopelagius longus TaxID=1236180 RepID=A0A1H1GS80_9EURY|nr:FAD-dependent oxidoreductase [Halopelagius longus]RDI69510.1 pyridine nucleotide-disulfide oxidoreductase [Halopelagius longus]SDR16074.1 NADPH-dependent 2,4-dienoyl-CoA reductase, sulfur reductase [Halopelagius longus]